MDWQTIMKQNDNILQSIQAIKIAIDGLEKDYLTKTQTIINAVSRDQQNTAAILLKVCQEMQTLVQSSKMST